VTLIDADGDRCGLLSRRLHQAVILHGDGTDLALLKEERVGDADVFVAASGDDETNLMASLLARQLGAGKTVTLVHRPDYVPTYELLGLDAVVSPRQFAAGQLLRYVRRGEVVSVSLLEGGKVEVLEIVPEAGSAIVGHRLADLTLPRGAVLAAVARADGSVTVPDGKTVLASGDPVVVFTLPSVRAEVERLFRKRLFGFG
jgi:trk system potassium uptake protein TrkA